MSLRAIVIWCALALLLAGGAWFALRVPSANPGNPLALNAQPGARGSLPVGARILDITPSSVRRVVVRHADGSSDVLDKTPGAPEAAIGSDAEWFLTVKHSASSPPASADASAVVLTLVKPWPIAPSRMQGLLRKIAETPCVAPAAADAALGDHPTAVELTLTDGSTRTLRLAERVLAGTGLVEIESSPEPKSQTRPAVRAIVSDELHRVFTAPGPRAWREPAFLASIAADASRVRLETPRQTIALARLDGRWSLREPAVAPADPGSVQRLLSTLSTFAIDDFLDDGAPNASTGLENPAAHITIEADRRLADPGEASPIAVARVEVVIGAPGDAAGKHVFASINDERLVLLDSRPAGSLMLDPAAYIWPAPTRRASADIGAIEIVPAAATGAGGAASATIFKRDLARWMRSGAAGADQPLVEQDLKDVNALAAFLTGEDRPAAPAGSGPSAPVPAISLVPPVDAREAGRIEIRSLAGEVLDSVGVLANAPGFVTLRTGAVFRTYPVARVPAVIAALADAAAPRAPATDETAPSK